MKLSLTEMDFRAIKNAPATILLLLMWTNRTMSQDEIELCTSLTDKTISKSLKVLYEYGAVEPAGRYEWHLSSGARQLPLMKMLEEEYEDTEPKEESEDQPEQKPDDSAPVRSENLRSGPSSSSGLIIDIDSNNNLPLLQESRCRSENFRPDDPRRVIDNLAELDTYGIREPARSRIAKEGHVTPELIRGHCRTAPNLGAAIHRIEADWRIPASKKPESGNYYDGEFGEFVDH